MYHQFEQNNIESLLVVADEIPSLFENTLRNNIKKSCLYKIIWNNSEVEAVFCIDNDPVFLRLPPKSILFLTDEQAITQKKRKQEEINQKIIAWGFNSEFYCILRHDKEISCLGFLFYGELNRVIIQLNEDDSLKIRHILELFLDEFQTFDNIQGEMLQMLLKRLIIVSTRIARLQHQPSSSKNNAAYDLIRAFNNAVNMHFKTKHRVADYAELLFKAPQTLTNIFAQNNQTSPAQIINNRILVEAKQLLLHTPQSISEIAAELGFAETTSFSRFFKTKTGLTPAAFRNTPKG